MSYQVFISYSTEDLEYARIVQRSIQVFGIRAFLADNSVRAGTALASIRDELHRSHLVVALWSEAASRSAWVRDELGGAWGAGKSVLPVRLTPKTEMPPSLSDVKYIVAYERDIDSILAIQAAVIAHWNLLLRQHEEQRAAWEAERKRQEAANNTKALGALLLGGIALAAATSKKK